MMKTLVLLMMMIHKPKDSQESECFEERFWRRWNFREWNVFMKKVLIIRTHPFSRNSKSCPQSASSFSQSPRPLFPFRCPLAFFPLSFSSSLIYISIFYCSNTSSYAYDLRAWHTYIVLYIHIHTNINTWYVLNFENVYVNVCVYVFSVLSLRALFVLLLDILW
jgi:hypothetical protein